MEREPRSHFHEVLHLGTGRKQSTILAYPKYRRGAAGWEKTRERIVPGGAADWGANESVHALTVANDGNLLLDHPFETTPHRLGMRLAALGVLRNDGTFDEKETPQSAVPTLAADNRLRWADYFPDIHLDVLYVADQARTILTITDDARRRLLTYRRTGSRLAFVWRLNTGALNHDLQTRKGQPISLGTHAGTETDGARCLSAGRRIMRMPRGGIRLAKPQTLADWQRWYAARRLLFRTRSQVAVMMEVVPWSILQDAPPGDLVLNYTAQYQQGAEGYSGCEDANGTIYFSIYNGPEDIPFGDENDDCLRIFNFADDGWNGGSWFAFIWIKFTIAESLGAITAATLDFTRVAGGGDEPADVTVYGCLRDVVETELDYLRCSSSDYWAVSGAAGSGTDHTSDACSDGQEWDGTTDLSIDYNETGISAWDTRQGDGENKGDLILAPGASGTTARANKPPDHGGCFCSSAHETTANRPILTLTYAAFKVTEYLRHRKYLSGSAMPYDIP